MTRGFDRSVWLTPRERRRDAGPLVDIVDGPEGSTARLAYGEPAPRWRVPLLCLAAAGSGLVTAAPLLVAVHPVAALLVGVAVAAFAAGLRLTALALARDRLLRRLPDAIERLPSIDLDRTRRLPQATALRIAVAWRAQRDASQAADAIIAAMLRMMIPLIAALLLAPRAASLVLGAAAASASAAAAIELRAIRAEARLRRAEIPFSRRAMSFASRWPVRRGYGATAGMVEPLRRTRHVTAWRRMLVTVQRRDWLFSFLLPAIPAAALAALSDARPLELLAAALATAAGATGAAAFSVQAVRWAKSHTRSRMADRLFAAAPPGGTLPVERLDEVALRGVRFRYPDAAAPILTDVTLHLVAGTVLALAGPSGTGKTTLLRLIAGLATAEAGEVLINGRPASSLDYRRRVAAVFQEEPIDHGTIRSLIAGSMRLALDEVWALAARIGIDEQIRALPMGMQTLVVEGPFPPSLLEPLLIARALAQDPELLILDEALGSLPRGCAVALLEDLRRGGRIVIFAGHDPALIVCADQVLRFGQVPGCGEDR